MPIDELGDRLKALALALRIELQELARKGGVTKATFSGYVSGDRLPRADTLLAWHKETHVDLHWLLTGEGDMFVSKAEGQSPVPASTIQDPVAQRMDVFCREMKAAGASNKEIRAGLLTLAGMKDAVEQLHAGFALNAPSPEERDRP